MVAAPEGTRLRKEHEIVEAVLYALRQGCFFPVREPWPRTSVKLWRRWGAMRNLHTKIAALNREG
jgi:hypothetical protein